MAEQPQGMEYTLQGVMRFLQIEWHNHERARNAWDIERAEMKAKIAKQEGENRNAKKINESLDRQVRMLERVVKQERAKNKVTVPSDKQATESDLRKKWTDKTGVQISTSKAQNLAAVDSHAFERTGADQDAQKDHAKDFCQKNVEELTYLVSPAAIPLAPPHGDLQQQQQQQQPNAGYMNQHQHDTRLEEAYLQQQQLQQHRRNQQTNLSHLPSVPNHHPPQMRGLSDNQNQLHPSQQQKPSPQLLSRPLSQPHAPPQFTSGSAVLDGPSPTLLHNVRDIDNQEGRVQHSIDAFGRSVEEGEEPTEPHSRPAANQDSDGWDFDDSVTVLEVQPDLAPLPPTRNTDTDVFPAPNNLPARSPTRTGLSTRRRSSGSTNSVQRRSDGSHETRDSIGGRSDPPPFKVRFALRGHLDVIRSIIFTGGGSPSEPEICTTGDDGTIKRWIIPSSYSNFPPGQQQQQSASPDLDIQSYFTHRGHEGIVTCLGACPSIAPSFSTGGRAAGDGWIFSGGQDATVRVWERGRVDPKATLDGHEDAIWAICVLCPASGVIFGHQDPNIPGDRILLASASADHTIKIWAVSSPPQLTSSQNPPGATSRRGVGGSRRHSITSGSGFPSSPQPSTASGTPFHYTLVHSIHVPHHASPTCLAPMGPSGENFVVGFADSSVLIFDTRTGEEVVGMASAETYDGTPSTGINSVVVASAGPGTGSDGSGSGRSMGMEGDEDSVVHGATGSSKGGGVEGVVITGHEDLYVRFFDANSGQCTYSMRAHPSSIACLALSPDSRELVTAGHDASLRFWSLDTRSCIQEISTFRAMRGEGVVSVVWSGDGRWVVAGGGDGGGRVFGR